jgi:streptogramin lyase
MKRRLRLLPAVAAVLALAVAPVASAAPTVNFPATIDLPDGFSPEGITTGAGNRIYVGSLAGGAIWAGNARTGKGAVIAPAADPVESRIAVGLDYEERTGRLWVAGGPLGQVHVFDARSGALLHSYTVPVPMGS